MSRIYSRPGESEPPRIDRGAVSSFFEQRATKIASLGMVRTVIYQDKHPDLAERRDAAEKSALLPLLNLNNQLRVLDIGCGTGRWTRELLPASAYYHGIDSSDGLLSYARKQFPESNHCRLTSTSADSFSLQSLGAPFPFDRVLCAGVLMYLNDDELLRALQCIGDALAPRGCVLFREPMGAEERLTISEHYSDDLEQTYNAIYRTEAELVALIRVSMPDPAFSIASRGNVFADATLNNRTDTIQRWLLVERSA